MTFEPPPTPPPGIALYDLDGTLIAWDCQLLFRHHVITREPWRAVFLPLFLLLAPFSGIIGTEGMKRVFLSYLWRIHPDVLEEHSRAFAASVMPMIYQELRETLEEHRRRNHLLILASASPECYVREIGRALGFHLSLGTPVGIGPLFPDLSNHKGAAKVERLKQLLPSSYFENGILAGSRGYTDSRADLPMLGICREATVVNPSPALTELAEKNGWTIIRPRRPWRSRLGFALRTLALLSGMPGNFAGKISPLRAGK